MPVLFLPGSGGSYQQVRSLASETAKQRAAAGSGPLLDWFAADFRGELSAFDGQLLERQRFFLLLALAELDDMYARRRDGAPVILIVGHSMGGVVARAALSAGGHTAGML